MLPKYDYMYTDYLDILIYLKLMYGMIKIDFLNMNFIKNYYITFPCAFVGVLIFIYQYNLGSLHVSAQ